MLSLSLGITCLLFLGITWNYFTDAFHFRVEPPSMAHKGFGVGICRTGIVDGDNRQVNGFTPGEIPFRKESV
jgi:hypothetical protein